MLTKYAANRTIERFFFAYLINGEDRSAFAVVLSGIGAYIFDKEG